MPRKESKNSHDDNFARLVTKLAAVETPMCGAQGCHCQLMYPAVIFFVFTVTDRLRFHCPMLQSRYPGWRERIER